MARIVISNERGIAQGLSALAQAMFPDPAQEARGLYFATGARNNSAQAALREQQHLGVERAASIASSGRHGPELFGEMLRAGMAGQAPEFALGVAGAVPGATPESLAAMQLGARLPYGHTVPGFRENEAGQNQRAVIAAGPGHARVAEERRQFDAGLVPVLAPDGSAPRFATRGEVAGAAPDQRPAPVLTQEQARGVASQRLAAGQNVPGVGMILAPGQTVASGAQAAAAANTPVAVMRDGRRTTIRQGELQPADVIIAANDAPLDMAGQAILAGQRPDPAAVQAATQLAQAGRNARGPAPLNVDGPDRNAIAQAVQSQLQAITGASATDPALLSQVTAAIAAEYQNTRDMAGAVESVMARVRAAAANWPVSGRFNPFVTNTLRAPADLGAILGGGPAAPAMPPGPAAPAAPASPEAPASLPPEARARLREGINVTFANGQVWTLRGGVPTQVR